MTDRSDFTVDGTDSIEELAEATVWHAENMADYAAKDDKAMVEACREKIQEHLDRIAELQSEQ